jgi:ketosteroid isomerase-like protein
MTAEEVLGAHRNIFYRSLINQDYDALADLYANEYMLVRPDGSVLNKEAVLHDLKLGGLRFRSIELVGEAVRIYGETAIVTGESRILAGRNGGEFSSRFRLVAVYTRHGGTFKLVHFQSTTLPAETSP